jgi:hypothetical protein
MRIGLWCKWVLDSEFQQYIIRNQIKKEIGSDFSSTSAEGVAHNAKKAFQSRFDSDESYPRSPMRKRSGRAVLQSSASLPDTFKVVIVSRWSARRGISKSKLGIRATPGQ